MLIPPTLQYKSSDFVVSQPNWRPPNNFQFAVPAGCKDWRIFLLKGQRDSLTTQDAARFGEDYVKRCRERGMQIGAPNAVELIDPPPADKSPDYQSRLKMREAASAGCQFVLFISSDFSTIHKHIKLEERLSRVITQDLKLKTVTSFMQKSQMLALDNIIYKTNLKLGGMNYGLSLKNAIPNYNPFPPNRLIIGITINQAPEVPNIHFNGERLPPPSVVGFCTNMANFPTEYIGDFIYQDTKKEDLILSTVEMWDKILDRFMGLLDSEGNKIAGEPKRPIPNEVILYRQGIKEGCYGACLTEEIPLLKAYLDQKRKGVRITYINVQKDHSVRLMPTVFNAAEKATLQNIGSGTVVDDQITHPRFKEFFLNSHITLQGTARTPRYTVLYDDKKLTMNELEIITYALAYNFQIVNSPVSIPAPLYVANRYAERGVDLYTSKQSDEMATSNQKIRVTIPQMNEDLTYCNTPLGKMRVNA
ncbi:hypothetical protein PENTCL1PPCAC_18199 [Pristionchus entomophagus]|uniref:Piwi domain-containing protein n=1 Tax=Pristionchus entomophagus TaxID=358040 RepID=A0AAV5TPP2_9BILA|nr:hypothetical protein PENTCL1PPCAC_18199 [Pristionchus entomophagus]